MFDPEVFKMKDGVLMFTKAANKNQIGEVWQICLLESMVKEVWNLCHQSDIGPHRGFEETLNKFLKGVLLLSARQKLRFLKGGCDTCVTKEQSMLVRTGEVVPSLTGYVGVKLYVDLVSMLDTMRRNQYLLTAEDRLSRYCCPYPIPNKEAQTMAKVLMDKHFNIYRLQDQLHSDNGKEFVNKLFSEFKIQHSTTPPYNPSFNPVECFHRIITAMLRMRGPEVKNNWDLCINASVFTYKFTVSNSDGSTF